MSQPDFSGIKSRLDQPQTRAKALDEVGEWVKDTCILFGATPYTAYMVAALFINGLEYQPQKNKNIV